MAKQSEPEPKTASSPHEEKPADKRRSGLPLLALLALILAVLSLLLQFWQWTGDDTSRLGVAVNELQAGRQGQLEEKQALDSLIQGVADRLEQLENRQAPEIPPDHSGAIADLQQETARLARQSGAVRSRLVEQSALTQSNDRHLARAEVEYLLKLGNERLQLFADREAALATLQLAEQQLSAMDDPLMLAVRRALQEDIGAVTSIQLADPVLILSQIQALETSLPDWPLKQSEVEPEEQPIEADTSLWGRFKNSMSSLVTIRKQNEPILTLEEIDWLQERMRTQFQVARIASLNGNQELYNTALRTVLQWHGDNYQAGGEANTDVRRSLQQLMDTTLKPELPDITRALREMQYLGSPLEQSARQQAPANTDDVAGSQETVENDG